MELGAGRRRQHDAATRRPGREVVGARESIPFQPFEDIDCLSPRPSMARTMSPNAKRELLPGMLDMLILRTLSVQPMHGYGIAQHLQRMSDDVIRVEEGTLYPALQRMRQKGWIKAEWGQTPNNQRARYYTMTAAGRRRLGEQEAGFEELMAAVRRVMRPA